tara:strand:- start:1706 stop:1924 length:219 start_codon:yes stop_codon:yes gene_type:complete
MNKNNIQLSILIYLIFIGVVLYLQPNIFKTSQGSLKHFGSGKNKTIFPFWLYVLLSAIFSYFLAQLILFRLC